MAKGFVVELIYGQIVGEIRNATVKYFIGIAIGLCELFKTVFPLTLQLLFNCGLLVVEQGGLAFLQDDVLVDFEVFQDAFLNFRSILS